MYPDQNFFNPFTYVSPGNFLIALGIFILVFLLVREILCWYWKINRIVDLLEDIKQNTHTTNSILKRMAPEAEEAKASPAAPLPTEPKV